MPELPAEAAIRADERARIAADLEARAKAIEDTHGENGDWLAEQFATHLPTLPIGGAVQDDPRTIAVEAYRGIAFAIVAPPVACPSPAPESTHSPQSPFAAPVYRSGVERPAETLSALRPHPHAATLRQRYANAIGFAPCTPFAIADAVLAVRDDELERLRGRAENAEMRQRLADSLADRLETVIARVREACLTVMSREVLDDGDIGEQDHTLRVLRLLDGAGAVPEHTRSGND